MSVASPDFAAVRPRVSVAGESRLLDEVVAELADEMSTGTIRITGGPGSGKSSALAHLAAVFADDDRFVFLDEPKPHEIDKVQRLGLLVVAVPCAGGRGPELALQPWGRDELIEYLLAKHHDACGGVIQRLRAAARWSWPPELASIVLDRFVADASLHEPTIALLQQVQELIPDAKQRSAANLYCLALLRRRSNEFETATAKFAKSDCPAVARKLLRHKLVQLPLAANRLISTIEKGDFSDLEQSLPAELVELTGQRCRDNRTVLERLRSRLSSPLGDAAHPMAASVLVAADPAWKPAQPRKLNLCWNLSGGIFSSVRWSRVDLTRATLTFCNFRDADLKAAVLEHALLDSARFDGANLQDARLMAASATNASFCQANLAGAVLIGVRFNHSDFTDANLSEAVLTNANLTRANLPSARLRQAELWRARMPEAILHDADFTNANLREANLSHTDLRHVCFDEACLEQAEFVHAQMEDISIIEARLQGADLRGAHLTGSALPAADLRGANLSGAGLAEIEWENADLRGANIEGVSFHMGSSRSGLVGSPIACEGSKTGFYTDDLDDMTYKRPEEIRKANLRRADLRGVKAGGVDFYLVDLREAQLDPALREQARSTGAILGDFAK